MDSYPKKTWMDRYGMTGALAVHRTWQIWSVLLEQLRVLLQVVYAGLWAVFQMCGLEIHLRIIAQRSQVQHIGFPSHVEELFSSPHSFKENAASIVTSLNNMTLGDIDSFANGMECQVSSFEPMFFNLNVDAEEEPECCNSFETSAAFFLSDTNALLHSPFSRDLESRPRVHCQDVKTSRVIGHKSECLQSDASDPASGMACQVSSLKPAFCNLEADAEEEDPECRSSFENPSAFLFSDTNGVLHSPFCNDQEIPPKVNLQDVEASEVVERKSGSLQSITYDDNNDSEDLSFWSESSDEECDMEASQRLWESFTSTSDPYNLFMFSAPISSGLQDPQYEERKTLSWDEDLTENVDKRAESDCVNFVQTWSVLESEDSSWDSGSNSGDSEEEDNDKLWESFISPRDPYNPLHFTACASSSFSKPRPSPCLTGCSASATEERNPAENRSPVLSSCSEEDGDSEAEDDDDDDEDDDDEILQTSAIDENEKLWKLFSQSTDPYHPLNFKACIESFPDAKAPVGFVWENDRTLEATVKKASCAKPALPKRDYKHDCTNRSTHRLCPWRKKRNAPVECHGGHKKDLHRKVTFSPVVHVHVMHAWDFALRAARRGPWEEMARDRDRFGRRIRETEEAIGYCLDDVHRQQMQARFQREKTEPPSAPT
ncbi:protein phosphatase 1 regulatory subunit 15B [Erpetoichthys calabaricus]|uniref:protein phosphatase 1 regulatory subunit 15B n=1 Tax=Erpetoichthys calabaricus TaxID=27687 RepID=UPI002234E79B|nr:protein phosphatase 1 regulatory subunit 15B [Erpetoichthys calabaricus]